MRKELKIVTSSWFPFKGYIAITILCWMIVRKDLEHKVTDRVVNHENIHYAQERELWFVGFYLLYAIFFLLNFIATFNWKKAYRENAFEREAYIYEGAMRYLNNRKRFAWTKLM